MCYTATLYSCSWPPAPGEYKSSLASRVHGNVRISLGEPFITGQNLDATRADRPGSRLPGVLPRCLFYTAARVDKTSRIRGRGQGLRGRPPAVSCVRVWGNEAKSPESGSQCHLLFLYGTRPHHTAGACLTSRRSTSTPFVHHSLLPTSSPTAWPAETFARSVREMVMSCRACRTTLRA